MNKPLLSLTLAVIFSAGLLWAVSAVAHQGGMANDSYVGDTSRHMVVPGSGGCVRTGSWTASQKAAGCDRTIVLQASALFDFDQAVIKRAGRRELDALAASLQDSGAGQIRIVGHTDSMGPAAYNQDLSMRRANAVKDYLVRKGIRAGSINTSGRGETRPVASNDTAAGRAMNRRVELRIGR
ncbi:MAG: OmpA family protein [Gammaproteobacteria bacterium]